MVRPMAPHLPSRRKADAALNAHGLIKVRVFDDRAEREALFQSNCRINSTLRRFSTLANCWCCAAPAARKVRAVDEDRKAGPRDVKVLKFGKPGQRPEVKTLRVLGQPAPHTRRQD